MKIKRKLVYWVLMCSILATCLTQGGISSGAAGSGDLNNDGIVNIADVVLLGVIFNSIAGDNKYRPSCDLNSDGVINMADVIIIAGNFNKAVTVPSNTPTPTPTNKPTPTPTKGTSATPVQIRVPISGMNMDTSQIKNKYLDVPYSTVSKTQTLDIFLPSGISGPYPVIVAIHGGAYIGGSSKGSDNAPMVEGRIIK
ncbi:dockerin type I domain-containing protein [Pseudobacteroides cellulosolvens]|uniref:Dockerin domain-containing protein n=1 Tax=Pseudobacteroides cellulosolvens ATCC 35603 = DSM 2933 TaxID=398512 RepID=A0A0L6JVM5_9FIRM|nr:dockerin type I domain-containing protein [Pseudobacteroides cellulosolvens]KNY29916.1 hypothetical protein Bccel_5193 [Pseudobacteroides cellulosolvens ATCC 35603 = DSM 2933]